MAFPAAAYDLLARCLCLSPTDRITAAQALAHPFLTAVLDDDTPLARMPVRVAAHWKPAAGAPGD